MVIPELGRVLGIDLGQKRIGLAISNPERSVASPIDVIKRDQQYHQRLKRVVQDWEIVAAVVGIPISLDGTKGPSAQRCETEAKTLTKVLGVPVVGHDERLSSVSAHRMMSDAGLDSRKQRKVVDKIAASIFLQAWLDSQ